MTAQSSALPPFAATGSSPEYRRMCVEGLASAMRDVRGLVAQAQHDGMLESRREAICAFGLLNWRLGFYEHILSRRTCARAWRVMRGYADVLARRLSA